MSVMTTTEKEGYDALVSGAAQALKKDGTVTPTANLPMGGFKLTGMAAGTAATDGATLSNRLDQFAAPTASVAGNAQEATGWADPTAAQSLCTRQYMFDHHPAVATRWGSDFASEPTGVKSATTPVEGWVVAVSGAGAAVTVLTTGNTDTEIGIAQIATGTTTTGFASLLSSDLVTDHYTVMPKTSAKVLLDVKVSIVTLSDGTNTFKTRVGFLNSVTSPTDGFWFEVDSNTDTHWITHVKSASSAHETTFTSSVVPVAGSYNHLVVIKNAGADSVSFYIDGTLITTTAADVPTTVLLTGCAAVIKSAGTTSRTANVDWAYCTLTYARAS